VHGWGRCIFIACLSGWMLLVWCVALFAAFTIAVLVAFDLFDVWWECVTFVVGVLVWYGIVLVCVVVM